jgi:F0F1-type ATP synthase alpha subunit
VQVWEHAFSRFMDSTHPEILRSIAADKRITDETMVSLRAAITEFKQSVVV